MRARVMIYFPGGGPTVGMQKDSCPKHFSSLHIHALYLSFLMSDCLLESPGEI